jgi:glycosyltransferase involved in cell wall biosynthesis
MQPRISIVLPVYNGERYLRGCINSVLQQTEQDFELIVGDDCSADGTRDIVREFNDSRIRPYFFAENAGLF